MRIRIKKSSLFIGTLFVSLLASIATLILLHFYFPEKPDTKYSHFFDPSWAYLQALESPLNYTIGSFIYSELIAPLGYQGYSKYQKDSFVYGIIPEKNYCHRSFLYFWMQQELFSKNLIFTDTMLTGGVVRNVVRETGVDVMPKNVYLVTKTPEVVLDIGVLMFYTLKNNVHTYLDINEEFKCVHQSYSHVIGGSVSSKVSLAAKSIKYTNKFIKNGLEECVNSSIFIESYVFSVKEDCIKFFNIIQSEEYKREKAEKGIVYILKESSTHRGEGVSLLKNESDILQEFEQGRLCRKPNFVSNLVAQRYISSPQTVFGHKFDFRIYLLISSANPLVAYYHEGFLRVSLEIFDINSPDKHVHFTNTEFSKSMFQNAEIQRKMNMTEEELRNFQMWNFTKLGDYLQKEEALPEKYLRQPEGGRKWIKEVLESQLISGLTHLVTIIDEGLNKASGFYQIFGVDFIMDDSFNLWLVECNTGPALVGTSKEKYDLMYGLVRDMFEIEFGLLRSRLKRVMRILNEISIEIYNETIKVETGLGNQKMIERKIQSYFTKERKKVLMERLKNANKDKFEPEWVPSENNGWVNIVDFGQNDRSKTYHPSFNTTCAPK